MMDVILEIQLYSSPLLTFLLRESWQHDGCYMP
jgi:hypothetical protein